MAVFRLSSDILRGSFYESSYHGHRAGHGVVAKVSAVCAELNINIEDVSQSIMQDMFCMIMLVDLSKANAGAAEVRDRFAALGKEMKMQVTVTRQEVFDAMHTI